MSAIICGSTPISSYLIDVIENFSRLQKALTELGIQICQNDASLPAWIDPLATLMPQALPNDTPRQQAFYFIQQLEYLDTQKPKEILISAGLLAASKETLQAILKVNECKDQFKKAMLALKVAKVSIHDLALRDSFEQALGKRPESTAQNLRKLGLARLHLKQCYRKIPFFYERPSKVSWTWANTRAITRITVQAAELLLQKQGNDPGIAWQLAKLSRLNPKEPLAIVQDLAPHLRANLVLEQKETIKIIRKMIKGPVPIFYLAEGEKKHALPAFRPPKPKQERNENRLIRSDVKLDPEPFLPAIRVHRYL